MKGIGLVLAGGGGKGAYQIGVWKYLHEYGLEQYVCALSGTSVGALNCALFAAGSFETAEQLWRNIAPWQILYPKRFSIEDIQKWIGTMEYTSWRPGSLLTALGDVSTAAFSPLLMSMINKRRNYAFSRDGLLELMNEWVDFSRIGNSDIPCFATCFSLSSFSVERFDLRDYSTEDAQTILLASSAIPIVFDQVDFRGKRYCDGGLPLIGDNVPVDPVYQTGAENIIIVHLDQETQIDRSKYPNARLIEITPRVDLGGLAGTLDFTSEGAAWRMEQGYRDAQEIFGPFMETAMQASIRESLFQAFQHSEQAYQDERGKLELRGLALEEKTRKDGFEEMCQELGID